MGRGVLGEGGFLPERDAGQLAGLCSAHHLARRPQGLAS